MDSLIALAAPALAAGDPLGALKRVALREDPPALRGIANDSKACPGAADLKTRLSGRFSLP
jgi:hypothetical protein